MSPKRAGLCLVNLSGSLDGGSKRCPTGNPQFETRKTFTCLLLRKQSMLHISSLVKRIFIRFDNWDKKASRQKNKAIFAGKRSRSSVG